MPGTRLEQERLYYFGRQKYVIRTRPSLLFSGCEMTEGPERIICCYTAAVVTPKIPRQSDDRVPAKREREKMRRALETYTAKTSLAACPYRRI